MNNELIDISPQKYLEILIKHFSDYGFDRHEIIPQADLDDEVGRIEIYGHEFEGMSPGTLITIAALMAGADRAAMISICQFSEINPDDVSSISVIPQNVYAGGREWTDKRGAPLYLLDLMIPTLIAWKGDMGTLDGVSFEKGALFRLGAMHTPEKTYWPVSAADAALRSYLNPGADGLVNYAGNQYLFDFAGTDKHLPNGSEYQFLDRSGMLSKAILQQRIVPSTLWSELAAGVIAEPSDIRHSLLAFCDKANTETFGLIVKGLLSISSDCCDEICTHGDKVLSAISRDYPALRRILESPIIILNTHIDESDEYPNPDEMMHTASAELFADAGTLTPALLSAISQLDQDDIGGHVYSALHKGLAVSDNQFTMDIQTSTLALKKLAQSITAFKSLNPKRMSDPGITLRNGEKAITRLVSTLERNSLVDYSELSKSTSAESLTLARLGVPTKELPNLTRSQMVELVNEDFSI